jgi:y4mF family transcriptional regulator
MQNEAELSSLSARTKLIPEGCKLADIILFHRKHSGLTQQELAELAGVGKNMVYQLESGKQSVRLKNLLKVLRVLNIELDFQSPLREAFLKDLNLKNRTQPARIQEGEF